jgi:hypothetical protein
MKKILFAAMALACTAAFAGEGQHGGQQGTATQQQQKQNTEVVSTSSAVSQSKGGEQQQQQGIQQAGNSQVTVGCLVNCADQSTAAKEAGAADIAVATINAAAAKEIAAGNQQAARDVAGTTQTIKNTPSIATAALVSSNDTCMGSVSVGGSGPGFSIGVGTTYKDDNCVMLKNSRELWNMGMKAAAMALMCTDKANKEALELTGFVCPQTEAANKAAVKKAEAEAAAKVAQTGGAERLATAYTGNDPIVQARMAASK